MELKWTPTSQADAAKIAAYLGATNEKTRQLFLRIIEAGEELLIFPEKAPFWEHVQNTHKWPVNKTTFALIFEIDEDIVRIIHIIDLRQNASAGPRLYSGVADV
jgi:hypothetical protein